MNIVTQEDETGWAPRSERWSAFDADTYDYPSPIGHGATPEAAIEDLRQIMADAEDAP